jgi:hypothetical protein
MDKFFYIQEIQILFMRLLKDLILNPVNAIKEAKRKKDINKSFMVLLINSILLFFSFLLFTYPSNLIRLEYKIGISFIVFVLNVFGAILLSFFLELIFSILGGKGKFYEGLTSVSYAEFPLSLALFISSLFFQIPGLGLLLSSVLLTIFGLISLSSWLRAIKEFFDVDWIVVWIGICVIGTSLVIAIYLTILALALSNPSFLTTFQ